MRPIRLRYRDSWSDFSPRDDSVPSDRSIFSTAVLVVAAHPLGAVTILFTPWGHAAVFIATRIRICAGLRATAGFGYAEIAIDGVSVIAACSHVASGAVPVVRASFVIVSVAQATPSGIYTQLPAPWMAITITVNIASATDAEIFRAVFGSTDLLPRRAVLLGVAVMCAASEGDSVGIAATLVIDTQGPCIAGVHAAI